MPPTHECELFVRQLHTDPIFLLWSRHPELFGRLVAPAKAVSPMQGCPLHLCHRTPRPCRAVPQPSLDPGEDAGGSVASRAGVLIESNWSSLTEHFACFLQFTVDSWGTIDDP